MTQQLLQLTELGLYCSKYDFYIDPKQPVKQAVVSHAHASHAVSHSENVYCTAPTKAIMQLRYGMKTAKEFHIYGYGESFKIGGAVITFFSAGHILGSAQVLIEMDGIRFLYTGDIKLEYDPTCTPAQIVKADILITETTFASKDIIHPSAETEILKLNNLKGQNILFGAYSLGKAQRITKLINQHCPNKNVLLFHKIAPIHQIYERFGVNLGKWELFERRKMKQSIENVYIVPPMVFSGNMYREDLFKVFASGWGKLQQGCDSSMFISDHLDWKQLLELIEGVQPTEIWTMHGDGTELKEYFEDKPQKVVILNG